MAGIPMGKDQEKMDFLKPADGYIYPVYLFSFLISKFTTTGK